MLDTPQQWDPYGFRDNKWDPCGFEDFCIRNVTMHQSKAVDATALPAKSLLSTIPLSPSSALPSPSTSEASGSTVNKPWNSMETQGNSMEIHIDGRKDIRHKARYPRESCSNRSLHVSILNR